MPDLWWYVVRAESRPLCVLASLDELAGWWYAVLALGHAHGINVERVPRRLAC